MKYNRIVNFDTGNARGLSVVLFVQGCMNHCRGCHNPQTWDFSGGTVYDDITKQEIIKMVSNPHINNFVVSGGDPLHPDNIGTICELLDDIRFNFGDSKNIIVYTGYTLEELERRNCDRVREIKKLVDVMVEGRFEIDKVSPILDYRGSTNQRAFSFKNGTEDISKNYFKYKEDNNG